MCNLPLTPRTECDDAIDDRRALPFGPIRWRAGDDLMGELASSPTGPPNDPLDNLSTGYMKGSAAQDCLDHLAQRAQRSTQGLNNGTANDHVLVHEVAGPSRWEVADPMVATRSRWSLPHLFLGT
jgi:hypothetical protein